MPANYTPTDDEASLLLEGVQGEQDAARRGQMVELLGNYRKAKTDAGLQPFAPDPAAVRQQRDRVNSLFDGLDQVDAKIPADRRMEFIAAVDASTDRDETKARMVNQSWVISQYPHLADAVDADWTSVKHRVAQDVFGADAAELPDTAFYGKIGAHLKKQKAENDMLADALMKVQMEAGKGDGDWLTAWKKASAGISSNPAWNPQNHDRYRQAAQQVFADTQTRLAPLKTAVALGKEYYRLASSGPATETGVKDEQGNVVAKTGEQRVADMNQVAAARQAFTDELLRLPADQRDTALNFAIAGAVDHSPKPMGTEGNAGFMEKATESLDRAIGQFPRSVARFVGQAGSAAAETVQQFRAGYYGESQEGVYAEQRSQAVMDIGRKIDAGLMDAVDPIKSNNRLAQGAYDAMQSVPYMVAASSLASIPLTLMAMAEDNRAHFVDNGVPAQEAATLALAAAVPQVAIENLQAEMVFHGKLPGFEKWLGKAVGTKLGIARKLVAVAGLETLHENAEEALQDITVPIYQQIGATLSEAVPDVKWLGKDGELSQYANSRVDTFFALLPMVLVGTGTASFKEAAYGRKYLENKTVLKAIGFTDAAAEQIAQVAHTGDVQQAQELVQAGWHDPEQRPAAEKEKASADAAADLESVGKFNTEAQQQAFEELDAQMKASWLEQANPEGARAIRQEDGTWAVVDRDGQIVDRAQTADAAIQLVGEVDRASTASTANVIDDMIAYFQERGRGGPIEKSEDIKTLADEVNAGRMTEDTAKSLVDLYANLGMLPKGTQIDEARIYGESERRYNAKEKIYEYVSRLYHGADPLVLIEEEAESYFKAAMDRGEFSLKDVEAWMRAVDPNIVGPEDGTLRGRHAVEFFSKYAQAYLTGKAQVESGIPLTLRRWLDKVRQVFAGLFKLAHDLIEMEKAGTLPDDFKTHLARAVGLDQAFIERRMRQEERAAAQKPERTRYNVREALMQIKLPTPKAEQGGMKGELQNLWTGLKFDQRMKLFTKEETTLDDVAERLREDYGFTSVEGPNEVIALAERAFIHGEDIYSDVAGAFFVKYDDPKEMTTFAMRPAANGQLIAVHNTSAEKLRLMDELGGIAAPSIAVIKHGTSQYDSFGDISLVAPPAVIDPRASKKAKVFNADVYSPRFPTTEHKVNTTELYRSWRKIEHASSQLGNVLSTELDPSAVRKDGLQAFEDSAAVKAAFLKENGIEPEIRRLKGADLSPALLAFKNTDRHALADDPKFKQAAVEDVKERYKEYPDLLADMLDKNGGLNYGSLNRLAGEVVDANFPKVDRHETNGAMKTQIEKAGLEGKFKDWIAKQFGQVVQGKVVRDYNENTGETRYRPYQMDTIVRMMKRELRDGEGFNYGVGSMRATVAKQFSSLRGMKEAAGDIVGKKQVEALKEETNDEFFKLAEELKPFYRYDAGNFGYYDQASQSFKELGQRGLRAWEENFKDTPPELLQQVRDYMQKLANAPTEYFEAKVQRAVQLSEMAGAVIPTDASKETRAILKKHGLTAIEYKRGDAKARADAVAQFGDASFSIGPKNRDDQVREAMGVRKISERVQESPTFAAAVKALVGEMKYTKRAMTVNEEEARKLINKHEGNLPALIQILNDPTQGIHPATRVALGFFLAEAANKSGDFAAAASIAKQVAIEATSAGQGVNEFKRWSIFDQPQTAQQLLQTEIEKENNHRREREPAIDAVVTVYADVQKEARALLKKWIDEINGVEADKAKPVDVSTLPDLTFALRADLKESGIVQVVARMLKESGADAVEKALVEKYGAKVEAHLTDIFIEAQKSLMGRNEKKDKKFKTRQPVLSDDQIERTIGMGRGRIENQEDLGIREQMKAAGLSDEQIEATLAQNRNRDGQQEELLPPERGASLDPQRVDAALDDARRMKTGAQGSLSDLPGFETRLLDHIMLQLEEKNKRVPAGFREQIGELLNKHGLAATPDDIKRIIGARLLLPDMTPAQAEKLAGFARRIASTPLDSFERSQQTMELFSYVHDQLKPYDLVDVAFGLWYANVLSGLVTSARNITGNSGMLFLDQAAETIFRNPAQYWAYLEQMLTATQAGFETAAPQVKNTAKTGQEGFQRSRSLDDERRQGVLESKTAPMETARSISRVATRFLAVQDLLFANTAYEMKARQLAWDQAQADAKRGKIKPEMIEAQVARALNAQTDQIQTFTDRAEVEWSNLHPDVRADYEKANWVKRRVAELRLFERDHDLVARSLDFAQKVTLDYQPEGLLGLLMGNLSKVFAMAEHAAEDVQNKPVRLMTKAAAKYGRTRVIPFMRVPVNIFNRALDYGPIGYSRALMDAAGIPVLQASGKTRMRTADERSDLLKRATLGTLALMPLAVLCRPAGPDDEPEDSPWLQIHGAGSGTPNTNLAQNGPKYRPYSLEIRAGGQKVFIDYRMFPLAPYLAAIGSLHDRTRYAKSLEGKSALAQSWILAQAMKEGFMSGSPITSLRELSEAAAENNPMSERAINRTLARGTVGIASNIAIPLAGLWRSLDQLAGGDRNTRDTLLAASMAELPVASRLNVPSIDVLGDPLTNRTGIGWLADWSSMETPEARIYRVFADRDVSPSDISMYQSKLTPEQYYAFAKSRGAYLKEYLLNAGEDGVTGLDRLAKLGDKGRTKDEESPAKKYLDRLSHAATRRALYDLGVDRKGRAK